VRVLVVGAGPNGLMAALRLARAGLDVTVLEHAARPGGGVTSGEDTLPGFVHDRCAAFFPLTAASPAFRGLGLERHGLRWIVPAIPMAHPFLDGTAIALHRDLPATVAELGRAAPGAGAGWRALVAPLLATAGPLLRVALHTLPPPPGAALRAGLRLRARAVDLARLAAGSATTLGREVLGHDAPTAWLVGSSAHADLGPDQAGSAAFALALGFLGHLVGWPLPEGGAQRLTDAMVAAIEAAGGRVRCRARVERILSRGGRVRAVRLADGEELAAEAIVATVSPGPLAAMLDDDALPPRILRRLRGWRYGLGTVKVDWALAGPVPWAAPAAREAAVVHLGDTLDAFRASFHAAVRGRTPAAPAMVVGQQSLHDPTRAPGGQHTLYAYSRLHAGAGEEAVEAMQARVEAFAPGFADLVLARTHRTSAQLERDNPSMVGGDLSGGSLELDQQLVFRPAPELVRHRTPLRGLYVASSAVHPGPAVHGVPGAGAAAAVLADRRRPWRRP
jgi:phytoene dehydrogenase-like protein